MRVLKKASDVRRAKKRAEQLAVPKPSIHIWEAETEETAESPLKKLRPAIIPWVGDKENASSSAPNEPAEKAGKAGVRGRMGFRRDPSKQQRRPKALATQALANASATQDSDMFLRREAVYRF